MYESPIFFDFDEEALEIAKNFRCGTGITSQIDKSFKNYHEGLPIEEGVVVDEVEMTVHDDWKQTGTTWDKEGKETIISAPLISVKGEEPMRLMFPEDIEGLTPIRGHEYHIQVRRFYWHNDPCNYRYELLKVLEDLCQ